MPNKTLDHISWAWAELRGEKTPRELYDELALSNKYDNIVKYRERVEKLRHALSFIKSKYNTVLDIGCGTGAIISALPHKERVSVIGIDISPVMLKVARHRFRSHSNIRLRCIDFMLATFAPRSFDLITVAHAVRFTPRDAEQRFFQNISFWLKKNGTLLIVHTQPIYKPAVAPFNLLGLRSNAFNHRLEDSRTLLKVVEPYFTTERQITLSYPSLVFRNVATYFRKK